MYTATSSAITAIPVARLRRPSLRLANTTYYRRLRLLIPSLRVARSRLAIIDYRCLAIICNDGRPFSPYRYG